MPSTISDNNSSSDDEYIFLIHSPTKSPNAQATLKVNSIPIKFNVDSGATVDLMYMISYDLLKNKRMSLQRSNIKNFIYGPDIPIELKRQFQAQIESRNRFAVSQINVAACKGRNLLSAKQHKIDA